MSYESFESDSYTHTGSLNSLLTEHGRKDFSPVTSKYVCHTSTIPLATTIDLEHAIRTTTRTKSRSLFHGSTAETTKATCGIRSCMFVSSDGHRHAQQTRLNCPCHEARDENGSQLEPICFLTYIKSLSHNLMNPNKEEIRNNMDPSRIMFCQDSQGILDDHYPGAIRDKIGVTGWGHVNPRVIVSVLDCLYWFRKAHERGDIISALFEILTHQGFNVLRKVIKQSLHTLNGLLCKKMFVFGPEISRYHDIASQTSMLFIDLVKEYGELYGKPDYPVFTELKSLFKETKRIFHQGPNTSRTAWLRWDFQSPSVQNFWSSEFSRLRLSIEKMKVNSDIDYTNSPAWFFRSITFSQTRNLGYLPPHMANEAFANFRETVSRPLEELSEENDQLIRRAVIQRLKESGIREGFLNDPSTSDEIYLATLVTGNINLDLKGSASVDHPVLAGGKLEDARLAIKRIRENNWSVPIRDLKTNEIVGLISYHENDDESQWNRLLFWYSYQLGLNWCAQRGLMEEELYHGFVLANGEHYSKDILEAAIVHIMEPGKIRDLVKGTGELAWALTPGAKVLQATLALLPEHRAGLEAASHDWAHSRRMSGESAESGFVYDETSGRVRPDVFQVFKDWKQSTDFIGKRVGAAHLGSFAQFIGFPAGYLRLILNLIRQPQPVREVTLMTYRAEGPNAGGYESELVVWNGSIIEGYMMGMPITKVILHLIHVSEREVVKEYLRRRDIQVKPGITGPKPYQEHVHIPRETPKTRLLTA